MDFIEYDKRALAEDEMLEEVAFHPPGYSCSIDHCGLPFSDNCSGAGHSFCGGQSCNTLGCSTHSCLGLQCTGVTCTSL